MGTPKNFTLDQASHSVCFCSFGYCSCDTAQVWATLSLPMLTVNNVSCLLSQEEFLSWYACSGRTPFHCTAALFLFQMERRTKFTVSPNSFFWSKLPSTFLAVYGSSSFCSRSADLNCYIFLDTSVSLFALQLHKEQSLILCLSSFFWQR